MKKAIIGLVFLYLGIATQLVFGREPSLEFRIDSPMEEFKDSDQFVLLVEIQNISDEACVAFPAYIRTEWKPTEGQGARFVAYPGPVVDPWPTAILLNGGQIKTIALRGLKNADGVWLLEHGSYHLSVSLRVAPTSTFNVNRNGQFENKAICRGTFQSNSVTVRYSDEK